MKGGKLKNIYIDVDNLWYVEVRLEITKGIAKKKVSKIYTS